MDYFAELEESARRAEKVALRARERGFDPELYPEVPFAKDLAERVEGLVGPEGIASRVRRLLKKESKEEAAIKIAREIVSGRLGEFEDAEKAAEQAVRSALALITEGIVAAPLEGIVKASIKKNFDGSEYLALYFAGPIRSAGGSGQALAVLVGDAIRETLGLARYMPSQHEIERFVEEVELYHSEAARLQYHPSPVEVRKAVKNIPIEITGEATDRVEVSGYRNLERVETNCLRGGAVLVLAEGVLQKNKKILKYVDRLGLESWGWLRSLVAREDREGEEREVKVEPSEKYIRDLVAGRPVFSHPSAKGGFRLRYGRSRASGFASMAMHPASMVLTNDFVAIGTQVKTERPGKATAVTPCDTIEGPIVKLNAGSVVRVESYERAKELRDEVEEVLFNGDILVSYGEFLENNHVLLPSGYCEEWWARELEQRGGESYREYRAKIPDEGLAIEISERLGIPLHPRYTYFYHDLAREDLKVLRELLEEGEERNGKLFLPSSREKHLLELLGVPHGVEGGKVILKEYRALLRCLGFGKDFDTAFYKARGSMELVNSFGIAVREKAPTYVGVRMGRPEKAKKRKMSPPVNVLFPLGNYGGRTRDIEKASRRGKVKVEVCYRLCESCGKVNFTTLCQRCGEPTVERKICPKCSFVGSREDEFCPGCGSWMSFFSAREVDLNSIYRRAKARVGASREVVKGVKGMTSRYKIPEALEKGLLRTKHGVYVFKDGTARYDCTDLSVTHLRARELGVGVATLRELGYTEDYLGEPLERDDQLVELKCQDIVLPLSGAEYLLKVASFVDELLTEFYGIEPYYKAEKEKDLIGHFVVGLAPHTSAAILGRIVGFSKANAGYAHPYFHAAKRRNCDGDEDGVFLLMDALLNFSKKFLPSTRGGTMDAPLVLTTHLDPSEVDQEVHNMDIAFSYPLEFYEASLRYEKPQEVEEFIETVASRLGTVKEYHGLGFTHGIGDINLGPRTTTYKTLREMAEKLEQQLAIARRFRAVDERDVARRVIETHFLPDLAGNLRAFSTQKVRCVSCNTKYRRVPLIGKCRRCGGKLVLTVSRGSVEKYLEITEGLLERYSLEEYLSQRIKVLRRSISSLFDDESMEQKNLGDF